MNETNQFINYIASLEDRITKLENQEKNVTVGSITFNNTDSRSSNEKFFETLVKGLQKQGFQSN